MRVEPLRLPFEIFERVCTFIDDARDIRDLSEALEPRHTGLELYTSLMKKRKESPATLLKLVWDSPRAFGRKSENAGLWMTRVLNGVSGIAMKPPCRENKDHPIPYNVADLGVRIGCFSGLPEPELEALIDTVARYNLTIMATAEPWANGAWLPRFTVGTYIGAVAVTASSESVAGLLAECFWAECKIASDLRREPHRPLHAAHTLFGALMLESLLRWSARARTVEDLSDRQRVTREAMAAVQSLSLERSYGSSLRQTGARDSSFIVSGCFDEAPSCLSAFLWIDEINYFYFNCPNLIAMPNIVESILPGTNLEVLIEPCPATGGTKKVVDGHTNPIGGDGQSANVPLFFARSGRSREKILYKILLAQYKARELALRALRGSDWNRENRRASAYGRLGEIAYNAVREDMDVNGRSMYPNRGANMQQHGWQDPLLGAVHFQAFHWKQIYGNASLLLRGPNFPTYRLPSWRQSVRFSPQPGTLRSLSNAWDVCHEWTNDDIADARNPELFLPRQKRGLAGESGWSAWQQRIRTWVPNCFETGARSDEEDPLLGTEYGPAQSFGPSRPPSLQSTPRESNPIQVFMRIEETLNHQAHALLSPQQRRI